MDTNTTTPTWRDYAPSVETDDGVNLTLCPSDACDTLFHHHGQPYGHRVAHCLDAKRDGQHRRGEQVADGYHLVDAPYMRAPMLDAWRRLKKRNQGRNRRRTRNKVDIEWRDLWRLYDEMEGEADD